MPDRPRCPRCGADMVYESYICPHCSDLHKTLVCLCGAVIPLE